MELLELLKQFKNIEPDRGFTKRSRALILREYSARPNFFSVFKNILEVGASLALAGLMVFVILGGLASIRFLQPLPITALDPSTIRAEAEAIDLQIKLADFDYSESAPSESGRESTIFAAPGAISGSQSEPVSENPENQEPSINPELSIDEALNLLSN